MTIFISNKVMRGLKSMGEAYIGNQHRFRILDSVLETTYNPDHALSAHMGYVLASQFSKYLLLEGGSMNGLLTTLNITPRNTSLFDIGAESSKYNHVYATTFHGELDGNAASATKLKNPREIKIVGSVTGKGSFDGTDDIQISTETNHDHDEKYLSLNGGTLNGNLTFAKGFSIIGTAGAHLLTLTQENILQINYGTFTNKVGNLTLYSTGDLDIQTHSSGITLTSTLHEKTVNLGTSKDSIYIQNTVNNDYLHITDDGILKFNEYFVYHKGNFDANDVIKSEYKNHINELKKIIKVLSIELDQLEVAVGYKEQLSYPNYTIGDDLIHYKNSSMTILDKDE